MLRRRVVWRVQDRVLETLHPSSSLQLIGGIIRHAASGPAYAEQSPHIRRIGMAARRTEANDDFQRLPLAALSVRNRRFKRERQSLLDRGYHSRLHLRGCPSVAQADQAAALLGLSPAVAPAGVAHQLVDHPGGDAGVLQPG